MRSNSFAMAKKRQRAAAVQDASRIFEFSLLRQLLDCGSLLPLSEESSMSMSSEREANALWLPLSLAYSRGFPFF
jgi:hypothetical protein